MPLPCNVNAPTDRLLTYLILAGIALCGVAWLASHDIVQPEFPELGPALLIVHGVSASLAAMIASSLPPQHIPLA